LSGDLKPGVRGGADAQTSSPTTASPQGSLVDAFHAGIAAGPKPPPAEDLRVPGKPPDISALMPWMDVDHDPATATAPRRTPNPAASTTKPVAPTNASTTAASTAARPPDFAETLATMKAAAFNLELEVLRHSTDPKAKYKVQDVLERADDSLTRKKMKEQYEAANDGHKIDSMIQSSKGLDERDKQHALGLMSDRRDATTDKIAALDPKARAKLEDDAAVWADKLLHITRSDDRDDSEHADQIANILGSRTPEELEVIRSRVRLQTSGTERTTTYEELDRTFTGRDKDIVLAGLTGSPTHLASTRLVDAAMEGDPARIHRIVKELKPEKLAELRTMNPMLLAQVASSMPAEHRAEIEAALGGRVPEAEGARIATLLQPVDLTVADTRDAAKTKRLLNRKEAQEPERMIEELGKMSAADLEAARDAWDKGNPGKSWDALIGERYKDADSTVRLRIEAAARGDKIGERALRLRQGMRTFDQQLIDGALYNSDLKSENPDKRSAAEAERRELEARMQQYDAGDQRTKAMLEGKPTSDAVVGRSTDEQLDAYYKKAELHDSEASGDFVDRATHVATKDERMAKVREKANADKYAAKEMSREGEAHASTKVRRAELSGNSLQKAEILEKLDSKDAKDSTNTLEAQSAEYRMKFGARDMIAAPKLSNLTDAAEAVAMLTGDERPPEEIAAQLSRDDMDVGQLRVEHVRETGVLADRTRAQRLDQQKEVRDLTHSGWLEGSEHMRFLRGGNRGSEDLLDSSINLMERGNAEGVDDREQSRRDRATTQAVELQRDEKQREAAKVAQVISIASKIAAIATANPALFVAVDAGFGLLRVAANELIANEANDMTSDLQHTAVDVGVNLTTAGVGRFGKGVQAGTQAAKGVQMAQRVGNVGAAVGGAAAHSAIDGEDGGGAVVRAAFGALLPGYFRGKAENAIQGTGKIANATRAGVGTVVDVGSNLGISGGHLDSGSLIDAVGNTVQGHGHSSSHGTKPRRTAGDSAPRPYADYSDDSGPSHAEAHDQPRTPQARDDGEAHAAYPRTNRGESNPFAHYADGEQHPSIRRLEEEGETQIARRAHHESEPSLEAPRKDAHDDRRASESEQDDARARNRLPQTSLPRRAAVDDHIREHGHPGVEVHSHFLGIASTDDFARFMGKDQGRPLTSEEMLQKMHAAVRKDSDYAAHYSQNEQGEQVFDYSGAGKVASKGGDAFENVRAIESAQAEIDAIKKAKDGKLSPEDEARIKEVSDEAVRAAMTTTQGTPFDGAYSIRDTVIKEYIDQQPADGKRNPYTNYTQMALEALERDGVHYTEQSQSVGKLTKGAFPPNMTDQVNADRAKDGKPPIDVRFLAMIETKFLGEMGSDAAGTPEKWKEQLDSARELMKRGDVIGIDFAAPEITPMSKGGVQLDQRIRDATLMLQQEGGARGRKLVLRPHVGEGYVEMPVDPKTGRPKDHDRDDNDAHYQKAQDNMRALVDVVDGMSRPGPNGEPPLYDPKNPNPEIRFGHSTHASPEIAADMKRLGIVAEVNLGSNAVSGSLQDNPQKPAGRDRDGRLQSFEDHSLLSLAAVGVPIILNTDGQSVMNSRLRDEYQTAKAILDEFRGVSAEGEKSSVWRTVPVDRKAFLEAHPQLAPADVSPPYELSYAQLPDTMKRNIDTAFERMIAEAAQRRQDVAAGDEVDSKRHASEAP